MADRGTLIDANVLLDIITEDEHWFDWSATALAHAAESGLLVINPIIYAEVSISYTRIEDLDTALPESQFRREPLPWEAAFLAGKAFVRYRRSGGARRAPLPDFYIGAHAAIRGYSLLTRDQSNYSTYYPKLKILSPG